MNDRFSPAKHLPQYTQHLVYTLLTPVVMYFAIVGNVIMGSSIFMFHRHELGVNPHVNSWFDSLWWALSTVTTVGYGDIVPVTTEGRIIGMVLMILGVVFFVGFTAISATVLIDRIHFSSTDSAKMLTETENFLERLNAFEQKLDALDKKVDRFNGQG
ncbi:MAG: two pore domain potassium channel family protein [Bdellovibrionales bacterium]|nr:two pore domain potassium channel family protein [Bdellovibrionales bacterium]